VSNHLTKWTQEEKKNIITVVISVIIAIGVNLEYSPYQTFHLKFPYWGLF
jgi:predicted negative regulator of RcsB-dependent stress response